jgi:nicotinate-nucleotide adenylyltransferase
MKNEVERIGVFGGTFDPPHIGHLIIAEQARQQLRLHKVLFVPAHDPPHKKGQATANPSQRLSMIKRAVSIVPEFEVSSIEIDREGVSYTVDTLRELRTKYRNAKFFLIVGGDNFAQLETWKSVTDILQLATPVVYDREEKKSRSRMRAMPKNIALHGAALRISSTLIRQRLKNGESIRFLVPSVVERYIRQHQLYQRPGV